MGARSFASWREMAGLARQRIIRDQFARSVAIIFWKELRFVITGPTASIVFETALFEA